MWKNWSLFKRRTEADSNMPVDEDVTMDGKENSTEMNGGGLGGNVVYNVNNGGASSSCSVNLNLSNCGFSQVNGYNNTGEGKGCVQANFEQGSLRSFAEERTSSNDGENGRYNRSRIYGQSPGTSLRRAGPSPFTPSDSSNLPGSDSEREKHDDGMNKSFSGVYGPLLSSPLVPKVRRALESSAGLRR